MNKKFLSAILFGALMVSSTGTFVSCKDYDDDVTELWDAINGQKTDLTAKVTAVEASIASLQTAQTALDTKIAEAKTAAEKAALEAQKAAIAAASAELATVKGELESSIAKLQGATEEEMDAIKADVEKTVAAIAEVDGKVIALQAFQSTTEETLKSLAEADKALAGTLATLDAEVKANAVEIGKNKAAIEAQKKALEDYIASNDAAVEANKGEIEDILVALGKQQEILDGLKAFDVAETQQAIEDLQTETGKLSEKISTIDNTLEVLSAAIYKGVTHVSLVAGLSDDAEAFWDLDLLSAEAVRTWTFGDKLTGAVSFEKGTRSTFTQNFLIRVSPTDAVISAENIKLINSQGADMEGMVSVSDVKPYTGLLTATRGISANGLWEVSVEMNKEYDAEAFKAATQAKEENGNYPKVPEYILYAVSLNTTLDKEKDTYSRNVVSEYNLTFKQDGADAVRSLDFTVDGKDVAEIHNRAKKSEETETETPKEYVWNEDAKDFSEPIFDGKNEKCNTKEGDDRQTKGILPVTLKKAFTVQLDDKTMEAATAFYIVLDKDRAVSSDDSEIEAWNAAEKNIKGINTVYNVEATKGKAEILIDSNVKDVYGFRVYAVNHDGSLVDPDGKAFYVLTGDAAEELNAYSVEKTWTANDNSEISRAPVAEGVFGDWLKSVETVEYVASEVDTVAYGSESKDAFTIKYAAKKDGTPSVFAKGTQAADVKFITIVTTEGTEDYWYDDAKTYTRTLEFKNARKQVLKTLTVNFKKVLPTFPSTFQAKVNQLNAEGTLNAFMLPIENGTKGEKDLVSSFNGLKVATDTYDQNFIFTFADAAKDGDEVKDLEVKYNGATNYEFNVTKDFIDNKKLHAVTVAYNFGKISSKLGDKKDYTVKGGEFKNIIFSCLAEINDYTWAKAPALTYAQEDGKTLFAYIKSENKRDGKYSTTLDQLLTDKCDKMIQGLDNATYELWSQVAKGGAIKDGSKNEYFTPKYAAEVTVGEGKDQKKGAGITFTPNSDAQNPEGDVYSTLIIKAKDYFDHDVVIEISDVLVKKR